MFTDYLRRAYSILAAFVRLSVRYGLYHQSPSNPHLPAFFVQFTGNFIVDFIQINFSDQLKINRKTPTIILG